MFITLPKYILLCAFGLICGSSAYAQSYYSLGVYETATTVAGKLELVIPANDQCEIRLNRKSLLRVNKFDALSTKNVTPYLSIYKHIKQPIAPFDEIIVISSQSGAAHFWGNGLLLLGLKKNGQYQLKHLGAIMANAPAILINKDAIKISVQADMHSTSYTNWEMPGGEWLYKNGRIRKLKTFRYRNVL